MVLLASLKVWPGLLNETPFHHLPVAVSSMATETALMWVPAPEFDEAVPVMAFVQFVP